jgi:hypothetical protein
VGRSPENPGVDVARSHAAGSRTSRKDSSESLFAALKRIFAERGWGFSEAEGLPLLLSEFSGPLGKWTLSARVLEEEGLIIFHSICPITVPTERRAAVVEFLSRVNYGLSLGNFEIDLDDGEVRFKTVLLEDGAPGVARIEKAISANGRALEAFLPGITAITEGTEPAQVIKRLS